MLTFILTRTELPFVGEINELLVWKPEQAEIVVKAMATGKGIHT